MILSRWAILDPVCRLDRGRSRSANPPVAVARTFHNCGPQRVTFPLNQNNGTCYWGFQTSRSDEVGALALVAGVGMGAEAAVGANKQAIFLAEAGASRWRSTLRTQLCPPEHRPGC